MYGILITSQVKEICEDQFDKIIAEIDINVINTCRRFLGITRGTTGKSEAALPCYVSTGPRIQPQIGNWKCRGEGAKPMGGVTKSS